MTTLEEEDVEEEEAGRSQDHATKKETHTYHSSVISCLWLFDLIIN